MSTATGITRFVAGVTKRYEDGVISSEVYHALLSAARVAVAALSCAQNEHTRTIEDEPPTAPIAKECTKTMCDASCADCVFYDDGKCVSGDDDDDDLEIVDQDHDIESVIFRNK
jgi:hypothetical protein